jgi:cytidine deaminase
MRELTRVVRAFVGEFGELSEQEQGLLRCASEVRLNAQAPYSNYHVGVAVLSQHGTTHFGCNVERCSWTQTSHAEQNAIDSMVAELGPTKVEIVALVAGPKGVPIAIPPTMVSKPISTIEEVSVPCGHCLQIIWENCLGDPNVKLIALTAGGEVVSTTIGDAFPMRFGPADLGVDYSKR